MIHFEKLLLILIIFFHLGCTTTQKTGPATGPEYSQKNDSVKSKNLKPLSGSATTDNQPEPEVIDIVSLQKFLRLDRSFNQLGYKEVKFNTCQVGFGYPTDSNCREKYFINIHFLIKCRTSMGTVSTIIREVDLNPVANRKVKWVLNQETGFTETDSSGYGQLNAIFNTSQRQQRLRLVVGEDFLFMKAADITKVVTPADWCFTK